LFAFLSICHQIDVRFFDARCGDDALRPGRPQSDPMSADVSVPGARSAGSTRAALAVVTVWAAPVALVVVLMV